MTIIIKKLNKKEAREKKAKMFGKKASKEWCVHITLGDYIMENIMAKNPKGAESIARARWELEAVERVNESHEIDQLEVMRTHQCGKDGATDNDINNKVCDNCGKKL